MILEWSNNYITTREKERIFFFNKSFIKAIIEKDEQKHKENWQKHKANIRMCGFICSACR